MDAARVAKRLVGPDGEVSVLYRRTRKEMPAAGEEVQALVGEGIRLMELTAPESIRCQDGRVQGIVCLRMRLGEKDSSGRPRPVKIEGSQFELRVDTVIPAIGQRASVDFFPGQPLKIDPVSRETQLQNVFAGGDTVRGASTLIQAIGDGKRVAEEIQRRTRREREMASGVSAKKSDPADLMKRQARRGHAARTPETGFGERSGFDLVIRTLDEAAAREEAGRCLQCDELCWVCVTVCPNRANIAFTLEPKDYRVEQVRRVGGGTEISGLETLRIEQRPQILNIGDYCNECGNCATFCPTSGAPYLDKARFHVSADSFASAGAGYHFVSETHLKHKGEGRSADLVMALDGYVYEDEEVKVVLGRDLRARRAELKGSAERVGLRRVLEMVILFQAARQVVPLSPGGDS
jgi:putative selenate reductase